MSPSGNMTPSTIQRFGYTAANAAASNDTVDRRPSGAIRQATSPVMTTTAVPIRSERNLWSKYVVPPRRDEIESTRG